MKKNTRAHKRRILHLSKEGWRWRWGGEITELWCVLGSEDLGLLQAVLAERTALLSFYCCFCLTRELRSLKTGYGLNSGWKNACSPLS